MWMCFSPFKQLLVSLRYPICLVEAWKWPAINDSALHTSRLVWLLLELHNYCVVMHHGLNQSASHTSGNRNKERHNGRSIVSWRHHFLWIFQILSLSILQISTPLSAPPDTLCSAELMFDNKMKLMSKIW